MDESFLALYRVYFETLRFLDPVFAANTDPQRSPLPAPTLSFGDALDQLRNARNPRHPVHASLALSWVRWGLTHGAPPTPDISVARDSVDRFLRERGVDLAEVDGAQNGSDAYLIPLALLGCAVKGFWVRGRIHAGIDVSSLAAGVRVDRKLEEFTLIGDPRAWSTTVRDTFEDTFRTDQSPIVPTDRPTDLDAIGGYNPPIGQPWTGLLFEQAKWPVRNLVITARNILNVEYQHSFPPRPPSIAVPGALGGLIPKFKPLPNAVSLANDRLFLRYSLNECLTTNVTRFDGDELGFGGIDRDSGFVDVRTASDSLTSISGKKSLRFAGGLDFLNSDTPAYLFVWITLTIIGAACYDFSLPEVT